MSKHAAPFLVPPLQTDPQLQLLNEKISKLAGVKPAADVFNAFGLVAHLSDLAIEATLDLQQMPGVDLNALQPTIKFWELVRDQSSTAALTCVGANHTPAGALVAFRLLRNIGGRGGRKLCKVSNPGT